LNKINVNLQSANLCLDQPFGNVHCLFVGDFFQHGSVKDRPFYKPSFGIKNIESNELTNTLENLLINYILPLHRTKMLLVEIYGLILLM
jgi:hypothetical protein